MGPMSDNLVIERQGSSPAIVAVVPSTSRFRLRYGLAIFSGAFLLFQVQLILGKYLLPWFGGAAAVWTTCMLFFQLLLLGGYLYAHLLSRRLDGSNQAVVHVLVLSFTTFMIAVGAFFWKTPLLPGPSWRPASADFPVLNILRILLVTVGLDSLRALRCAPRASHRLANRRWITGSRAFGSPTATSSRCSAKRL